VSTKLATSTEDNGTHSEESEDDGDEEGDNTQQSQIAAKNNFSFKPRRPILNPVDIARQEQEKQIQMKNEAKERSI
jgi:hypothetical protein